MQLGPPKLVLVKEKLNSWQELGVVFSADPKGRTGYDLPEYISFRGWREINRFLDGVHTIADLKAAAESAFVIHTVLKETEEEVDARN